MGIEIGRKKGQAAMWIILIVFLVAAIALFLLLQGEVGSINPIPSDAINFEVNSYLSRCVGLEVEKAVSIMLPQGGFIAPTNYRLFNRTTVEYICETKSYFEPCINQHPVLINEMEGEILGYISQGINACIREMEYEIEKYGGTSVVDSGGANVDVELEYDKVIVKINQGITVNEKDVVRNFNEFVVNVMSPIYNLGVIAQEIANQEASFCYFETTGYSLANSRYKVVRKVLTDQSKIYVITDGKVEESMLVAVRSCALPEGMPG
ncbi:MAG: hypothetical protein ABIH92_02620 [Nanoarchaeota archaeon]